MERGRFDTAERHLSVILAAVNDETAVAFLTLAVLVGLMLLILYLFLR